MHKKTLLASSVLTTMALPAVASAELTANVGWVSDYIFRGYFQEDSSAYAGVDYAADSGFYAGVWGADVAYGLEIDLYAGYSGEFGESGGYTVGFTGYFYTEDDASEPSVFDDTYTEVNLGISYGIFSIDHAIGEWDGFGTSSDYTFTTVAISPDTGPYYSYNTFGDDSSGDYFEIGYGWSSMDLDFSVAFLYDLNAGDPDSVFLDEDFTGFDDTAFTFGVSKTFALDD